MLEAREEASELGFVFGHVQRLDSNCKCEVERFNSGIFKFFDTHTIADFLNLSLFIKTILRSIYSSHSRCFTTFATCILRP